MRKIKDGESVCVFLCLDAAGGTGVFWREHAPQIFREFRAKCDTVEESQTYTEHKYHGGTFKRSSAMIRVHTHTHTNVYSISA